MVAKVIDKSLPPECSCGLPCQDSWRLFPTGEPQRYCPSLIKLVDLLWHDLNLDETSLTTRRGVQGQSGPSFKKRIKLGESERERQMNFENSKSLIASSGSLGHAKIKIQLLSERYDCQLSFSQNKFMCRSKNVRVMCNQSWHDFQSSRVKPPGPKSLYYL